MKFALLASGSAGNCCVVKHKDSSIVIDCGSTRKYLMECFGRIGYDPKSANAILITHTHSDHVSQMKLFDETPTYATQDIKTKNLNQVAAYDEFDIDEFHITVLPMSHDCDGTVGYIIEAEGEKMVYVTDTGYVKDEVKQRIINADYYVFESNHDIEMLMQTNRPVYLKQRIIGDTGHLCNEDCANIICEAMGEKTKEIILAHISREGNTRDMALQALERQLHKRQKQQEDLICYPAEQFGLYVGGNKK